MNCDAVVEFLRHWAIIGQAVIAIIQIIVATMTKSVIETSIKGEEVKK